MTVIGYKIMINFEVIPLRSLEIDLSVDMLDFGKGKGQALGSGRYNINRYLMPPQSSGSICQITHFLQSTGSSLEVQVKR